MMDVNMTGWWLAILVSVLCACALFFVSLRKHAGFTAGRSVLLSACVLSLGAVFGILGAKIFYFVFRFSYIIRQGTLEYWLSLRTEELSYYGGAAGVVFAVFLSAKLCRRDSRKVLNAFAPSGALLAAGVRFAEYFLFPMGTGAYLDNPLPFPLAVRLAWSEDYSEYYLAVFFFEGVVSLAAFVLSLVHKDETRRMLRTLFYLCLPQILLESLRTDAINLLFVHLEQLTCYLFVEGVLIWYTVRLIKSFYSKRTGTASLVIAIVSPLAGLILCGMVVLAEFLLDGKLLIGGSRVSPLLIYSVMAAGLAGLAVLEYRANRLLSGASYSPKKALAK